VPLAHKVEPVTTPKTLRKTASFPPVHCSHGHPRLFASVTFSAPKPMGLKLKSSRCRRTGLESSLKEVPHGGDGSAWPAPAEILNVFVHKIQDLAAPERKVGVADHQGARPCLSGDNCPMRTLVLWLRPHRRICALRACSGLTGSFPQRGRPGLAKL